MYDARVARGEPAPSVYTPPYTCKTDPRIPPLNTLHRSKLAYKLRRDPPEPELRHPRADAAGLGASHRQCLRFVHSYCLLRVSWWATHSREGCRHLCRDLGETYQVSSASCSAGYATGCSEVDTRWGCCCLSAWKTAVVLPPMAHHTAQHLRALQSPVPRFGEQSQATPLAHRQPPPRGAYPCVIAYLDCSACCHTHVWAHDKHVYCSSRQSLREPSSYLVHAAGAMPEPDAEQPPPPQRGNVENDAIGPGSEPMEPEDGLQGSSQKEPLSHGIGRMCRGARQF